MKTWLVEIRTKDRISTENPVLDYVEVTLVDWADEYNARHVGFDVYAKKVIYQPKVRKHLLDVCRISTIDPKEFTNYFCAPDAVQLN